MPVECSRVPRSDTAPILECALEMLASGMPGPGHLADIPCGTGYLSSLAAARLFRLGRRAGLPEDVRAMLSSPRVLCGRTAVIRARLREDSPSS